LANGGGLLGRAGGRYLVPGCLVAAETATKSAVALGVFSALWHVSVTTLVIMVYR
jgi:hypothetical protein